MLLSGYKSLYRKISPYYVYCGLRSMPIRKMPVPRFEKRLDVVIIGPPNVGKSVLMNTLLREKLAATSRKKHTTRLEILGVFNHRNVQLAFYDTPGFLGVREATKNDSKSLRQIAATATEKADVVLMVVDATQKLNDRFLDTFAEMIKIGLQNSKKEIVLVLNKVDLVNPKSELLETTRKLVSIINGVKLGPDKAHLAQLDTTTFMISALQDDGVLDLKNYLIAISESKPWIIPKDQGITDLSSEERIEQVVLEKMLDNTHNEVPYICDIQCKSISDTSLTRVKIEVDIRVDSTGQQRIIVGQQGRTLVKIRQSAVEVLEKQLGKQVILYLWVNLRNSDRFSS